MQTTPQSKALNTLLATSQVIANNVKGRHWLVSGTHFRSLHLTFDEIWETFLDSSDKIAETIRVIDDRPYTSFIEYEDNSVVASDNVIDELEEQDAEEMVKRTRDEINSFISHIHAGVRAKVFDPTAENDLLNITSELRHHVLFLDGFLDYWATKG